MKIVVCLPEGRVVNNETSGQQVRASGKTSEASSSMPNAPKGGGKMKRQLRNFLLQPLLQMRIGLYAIVLALCFSIALGAILYANFADLISNVLLMTDAQDEVREIFMSYWHNTQLWVYLSFFIYLMATVTISVLYTHKLVGPTVAFRRHIRSLMDGRFTARTYLRKGDAFAEVAEELNHLSEVMEKKYGNSEPRA